MPTKDRPIFGWTPKIGAYAALKEDPSKHVIVPGDPMQSALYARLITTDTAEVMPPPSSNLSLTKNEIEIIKKWIAQGAKYKKHWSFIAPVRPKVPEADEELNPRNPIDHFIFKHHGKGGLGAQCRSPQRSLAEKGFNGYYRTSSYH